MTAFTKQTFKDIDSTELLLLDPKPWDILQLKYDGHWCRLEFDEYGNGRGYTTSDRLEVELTCPFLANCVFIGEHMFGTNWAKQRGREGAVIAFDAVVIDGEDISKKPYSQRWDLLVRRIDNSNHGLLYRAMTKPIGELASIWHKFVLGIPQFEGVVLRKWDQPYATTLHRAKRDVEVTYIAVGFTEGQGKHAGRLGAIQAAKPAETEDGVNFTGVGTVICSVGGGFSDEQRIEIWNNKENYLGREFDATGKQLFESGALRHPNFVRWK